MSALNTQIATILSTQQVIVNHISVPAATEISGYNTQYLRRLLRAGKLDGRKVGQILPVNSISLQEHFRSALSSVYMRYGSKGLLQAPFY